MGPGVRSINVVGYSSPAYYDKRSFFPKRFGNQDIDRYLPHNNPVESTIQQQWACLTEPLVTLQGRACTGAELITLIEDLMAKQVREQAEQGKVLHVITYFRGNCPGITLENWLKVFPKAEEKLSAKAAMETLVKAGLVETKQRIPPQWIPTQTLRSRLAGQETYYTVHPDAKNLLQALHRFLESPCLQMGSETLTAQELLSRIYQAERKQQERLAGRSLLDSLTAPEQGGVHEGAFLRACSKDQSKEGSLSSAIIILKMLGLIRREPIYTPGRGDYPYYLFVTDLGQHELFKSKRRG